MHHVAIMKKSWKLIPKILSGEKTIESRWYMTKRTPWDRISVGDSVFFRDTSSPIAARAQVAQVLQFEKPSQKKFKDIISSYGKSICFVSNPEKAFDWVKDKNYVILVFLKNPKSIKPFNINKTGFGNACAWITVKNVDLIQDKG